MVTAHAGVSSPDQKAQAISAVYAVEIVQRGEVLSRRFANGSLEARLGIARAIQACGGRAAAQYAALRLPLLRIGRFDEEVSAAPTGHLSYRVRCEQTSIERHRDASWSAFQEQAL